jgi:hypothetical protein
VLWTVVAISPLMGCSVSSDIAPSISWVSTDRSVFEPEKGEVLTLRFRISSPSEVTVRFIDPFELAIRTIERELTEAGEHSVVWDGRDDGGNRVCPEAYVYTLSARALNADESAEPIVYDLRRLTGGEEVRPLDSRFDGEARRLEYSLTKPSRVRLILTRMDWPVKTVEDWSVKPAGRHEAVWRAEDALGPGPSGALFHGFALADNTVLVKGAAVCGAEMRRGAPVTPPRPWVESERELQLHAGHARALCYNPPVRLRLPDEVSRGPGGVPVIGEPVVLTAEGPQPSPRGRVMVFRDGELLEETETELPYQWRLKPSDMGSGEHVLTVGYGWPEDHFGFAHLKVVVEESTNQSMESSHE